MTNGQKSRRYVYVALNSGKFTANCKLQIIFIIKIFTFRIRKVGASGEGVKTLTV